MEAICPIKWLVKEVLHSTRSSRPFFTAVNPFIPTPATSTPPNWKIDRILTSIKKIAKESVALGDNVSVDE